MHKQVAQSGKGSFRDIETSRSGGEPVVTLVERDYLAACRILWSGYMVEASVSGQ